MDTKTLTTFELEAMSEDELEAIIQKVGKSQNDARYVLGKLMIEASSDKVTKNEGRGLLLLKEASKKGHMASLEYKTYWDIRFDKQPKIQVIKDNLQRIIDENKSPRACNTLAELNHASAGS